MTEAQALYAFYQSTKGATEWSSSCKAGWTATSTTNICSQSSGDFSLLYGITCNKKDGKVTQISLVDCQLEGTLPLNFIASFSLLANLTLEDSKLSGELSDGLTTTSVASLPLQKLELHSCTMDGTLPASWSTLFPNLKTLSLQRLQYVTGPLPSTWSTFAQMQNDAVPADITHSDAAQFVGAP